ncbi:hypothetical protein EJB05_49269 [Eragrostis curvula]|uniref:Response regulatory domain-containing protein n=1 Tax=Eragrostis curvula TaxID=38414 RepID=A0A5J9T4D0_9POAL|nr:hypothetical protein EJB05_49269 [Eragrostis curvula]
MAFASPHVLVVDDGRVDRMVVTKVLKKSKVRVTAVDGAEEALNFLNLENDVNLIFTDYHMPGMTGYDLLKKVKESPKLKHLPVVITSTEENPEIIEKCMEGGAKGFILKPINLDVVPRLLSFI